MASKTRAPDISEQEASVAYFDLALNGLLLNEIEDCFDGILKGRFELNLAHFQAYIEEHSGIGICCLSSDLSPTLAIRV